MKNFFRFLPPVLLLLILFASCNKVDMTLQTSKGSLLSTTVKPYVAQNCNPGYVWDPIQRKCVPVPTIISYAGVSISYYTSSHTLGFNNINDVNTVINQLDSDYESYNTAYENQYPNFTALQLDSLDSVKNFDQLQTYKNFEAKFAGYTSERSVFDNNETTWLNNNTTGADPDSLDYTVDNSENAICNNNYQFIIADSAYQWTSTGLVTLGGIQTAVINTPTSGASCFTNHRKINWFYSSDNLRKCKLKVAILDCLMKGSAKTKAKSFRKKSNGKWIHSRISLLVNISGTLYDGASCSPAVPFTKTNGYKTRTELKAKQPSLAGLSWTQAGQIQGLLNTSLGFNGSITLQ